MTGKRLSAFLLLLVSGAGAQEVGRPIFSSTCAACHGLDGRGGEHAPNIAMDSKIRALPDRDLQRIVRAGIPAAGMPGFGSSLDERQIEAVVAYLRLLQGEGKTSRSRGDAERGRRLFVGGGGCDGCHSIDGNGGFLGGDLSAYGSTHTPAEIRSAIVDPGKNADPRHRTVIVVTRNGTKYSGVVRNEDNFSLQIQTADGHFHFFEKSPHLRIEHPSKSLMPSDYESKLGSKGVEDIVSYLMQTSAKGSAGSEDDDQ